MAEGSESTPTDVNPADIPPNETEQEPKRRRGRPSKAEQEAEEAAALAALPPFHPSLVAGRVNVIAKRVVRTGQYESFDLMIQADFERDPRYGVAECIEMVAELVTGQANAIAERIQREISVEK